MSLDLAQTAPLAVPDAQRVILEAIAPLGVERRDLLTALGRTLWEDVVAPGDIPPHDNSAMDGYAVRSADLAGATKDAPVRLRVVGDLPAGQVPTAPLAEGEAIRIMTGAPIPAGADSVVMVERTAKDGGDVLVSATTRERENIRARGEDVKAGSVLLDRGTRLHAAEVGTLAAMQRSFLTVVRRPRVAVLATGDELAEIDEPLAPGKIANSNAYTLTALIREAGAEPILFPLVRDSEAALEATITEAHAAADYLVSSGGVSVGDYDFVKPVLARMGLDAKFWRVWMKPGKPLLFGLLRDKPYFGLPGNPVSSMLTFLLFVRPAIRKALGYGEEEWLPPQVTARLEADVKTKGDRPTYLRARVRYHDGAFHARVMPGQGSAMLSSMLGAEGLVLFPEGKQTGAAGEEVTVLLIRRVV